MTTSLVNAQSVLAIEVGSVHTRGLLFDVVDGQYHFIAGSMVPSSVNAPFRDLSESAHLVIAELEKVTGQIILDKTGSLILPVQSDGSGVDCMVISYSAGPELKVAILGLLNEVSLESARHLVSTIPCNIVEVIGLNDRRGTEGQLDSLLHHKPDLILLTGGTDRGANRSVLKLAELVALTLDIQGNNHHTEVIYAGNQALARKISEGLEKWTTITVAPNLRPSIDLEDLSPAQVALTTATTLIRSNQIGGLSNMGKACATPPTPSSLAFGRMIRFLSKVNDSSRGVLGVDVGSSATIIAAAFNGKLNLNVTRYGIGSGVEAILKKDKIEEISRWLPMHVPDSVVRDYLMQKTIRPGSIPVSAESLAIEQAAARESLRLSMREMLELWPNLLLTFEPILAGGAILGKAPSPAQALMTLLDGLQPVGITTILLDQHGLTTSLGTIASANTILPVQITESGAYLNLGTVICPISRARFGTTILRLRMEYEGGSTQTVEVQAGSIVSIPLPLGQTANLHLQAMHQTEIDPYRRQGTTGLKVNGGICGVVIDARGRPIHLPPDAARRRELHRKWLMALGG
jgi:hypothetical protein